MLQPGKIAPAFSLPDADMQTVSLGAYRGKKNVVLYFYPRDGTPGCTLQAVEFSDHEDQFNKHDCIILGVSRDDCLTHASFRDKHGVSISLLSDLDSEVCRLYGVLQEKDIEGQRRECLVRSTFVIDKKGVLRHVAYGVNPRGHAAEVFDVVRKLKAWALDAIGRNKVVSMSVELHDAQGALLHAAGDALVYLHGGHGGLPEALEQALEGRTEGELVRVHLEPEQAFGDYDPELLRVEPRSRYGEGIEVGMEVEDTFDGGAPQLYLVTDVAESKVVLDANHPLAGMALEFTCRVLVVRDASPGEIERGAPDRPQ